MIKAQDLLLANNVTEKQLMLTAVAIVCLLKSPVNEASCSSFSTEHGADAYQCLLHD